MSVLNLNNSSKPPSIFLHLLLLAHRPSPLCLLLLLHLLPVNQLLSTAFNIA